MCSLPAPVGLHADSAQCGVDVGRNSAWRVCCSGTATSRTGIPYPSVSLRVDSLPARIVVNCNHIWPISASAHTRLMCAAVGSLIGQKARAGTLHFFQNVIPLHRSTFFTRSGVWTHSLRYLRSAFEPDNFCRDFDLISDDDAAAWAPLHLLMRGAGLRLTSEAPRY
jgi:hypothetical protein